MAIMTYDNAVDLILTPEALQTYVQELRREGSFGPAELTAAAWAGATEAEIADAYQNACSIDPLSASGGVVARMQTTVLVLKALAGVLTAQGELLTATQATNSNLLRPAIFSSNFVVGNPEPLPATVVLRSRNLDIPPDWAVILEPTNVRLVPGEEVDVSVLVIPASPVPAGARPRIAVEGYVAERLLSGVVLDILVPDLREPSEYH